METGAALTRNRDADGRARPACAAQSHVESRGRAWAAHGCGRRMLYSSFKWPSAEVLGQLVRDAHGGRASAVEELLTILRPSLLAFFQRRHSIDNAEDLTQLAMIRIAGAISRIDPARADSYISTVARNLLRTAYKASAKDRSRKSDVDALD